MRFTRSRTVAGNSHPGLAKYIGRRKSFLDYVLYLLLILSILSIGLVFIQNNKHLFDSRFFTDEKRETFRTGILNIHWIDYTTSIALFAGLFTILFARYQFSLSLKPILSYTPRIRPESEAPLRKCKMFSTTVLENLGTGLAIVIESKYRISFTESDLLKSYRSYSDVVDELAKLGYIKNKVYWLSYFSKGSTIAANSRLMIFEMPTYLTEKLFAFDIRIEYSGLLGDKYVKEIFCIPRPYRRP